MSVTLTVSNEIAQHLNDLSFGKTEDVNEKLRDLLISEYRRRLSRYGLTDRQLTRKYNMNFETFEKQQMTKQLGYTWEVESDAIAWETAVDGIRTMKQRLANLTAKGEAGDG